jgi:hypothetical protein
MTYLLAAAGVVALIVAGSGARAAPATPEGIAQALANDDLAYAKWKGGKDWKGWKGKKVKWRRGPPPWAPAWGYRRKRGW